MNDLIQITSILLPLFAGILLVIFARRGSHFTLKLVTTSALTLNFLFNLYSLFMHPPPGTICISWLASAGPMCMTSESPPLILIALSVFPLLIFLFLRNSPKTKTIEYGLMLIAVSLMQVSLLSGHFMLRYIALEFIGLVVTLAALLLTAPPDRRWTHTKQVFINLRIADLGLLASIFIMHAVSQSFDITQNFTDALSSAPTLQILIALGLLIGIWVKLALPPINQWHIATQSIVSNRWLLDIWLPLLGAYLLYRSVPLLTSTREALLPSVLAFTWASLLFKIVLDRRAANPENPHHSDFHFSAVFLILGAFRIEQTTFWTVMLFWLVIQIAHGLLDALTARRTPDPIRQRDASWLHLLLSQGFALLLIGLVMPGLHSQPLLSIALWGIWWLHTLHQASMIKAWPLNHPDQTKPEKAKRAWPVRVLLPGLVTLTGVAALAEGIARHFRGNDYSILSGAFSPSFSQFILAFGSGLAIALILLATIKLIPRAILRAGQRKSRSASPRPNHREAEPPSSHDPLDFYDFIKNTGTKIATFIYRHAETAASEPPSTAAERPSRQKEHFSFGNFWNHTLELLLKASHKLSGLHHGLLRYNLFWLLIFIVGISLVVVIGSLKGWG